MTPENIALVKESHALVVPIAEQAADLFCQRLFTIAPETKALFVGDMKDQGRKLMATLVVAYTLLAGVMLQASADALQPQRRQLQ